MSSDHAVSLLVDLLAENQKRLASYVPSTPRAPLGSVGVVGAGTMGLSIAAMAACHVDRVVLHDSRAESLETAPARAADLLSGKSLVESRLHPALQQPRKPFDAARLHVRGTLAGLADCDLVVEAIPESVEAKHRLYAELAGVLKPGAVLVSNTSAIPITRLAAGVGTPDRFCGVHFLAPVRPGSLVEIVPGEATSRRTLEVVVPLVRQFEVTPIVVDDQTGFVANRLLSSYLDEGAAMLADGASVDTIDRAAERFGMVVGPMRILDEIGIDTALAVGRVLWQAYSDRVEPSPATIGMYKRKRLGRKSGAGFYRYASRTPWADDAIVAAEVDEEIAPWLGKRRELSAGEFRDRLPLALLAEAVRLLDEGAADGATIDLISVVGLGFPAATAGILRWADQVGIGGIVERMERLGWAERGAGIPPLLLDMARSDRVFWPK